MAEVSHQAITWANVDPGTCRYIASLGLNELNVLIDTVNSHYNIVIFFSRTLNHKPLVHQWGEILVGFLWFKWVWPMVYMCYYCAACIVI